ncbi:MAG: hypothetical protein Q8M37_10120 [Nevskia sp.]|nr:hypothetical protein [Nevskia sp.]
MKDLECVKRYKPAEGELGEAFNLCVAEARARSVEAVLRRGAGGTGANLIDWHVPLWSSHAEMLANNRLRDVVGGRYTEI